MPSNKRKPRGVLRNRRATETQRNIGVEMEGKHYNVPTIQGGKRVTAQRAIHNARKNPRARTGPYPSQAAATSAAKSTSKSLSGPRAGPGSSEIGKEAERIKQRTTRKTKKRR